MNRCCGLVAAALVFALTGCDERPLTAVDYDPAAAFAGLKTYRWMEDSGRITADRQVVEPETGARVVKAIDTAFAARGFTLITDGKPDFLVGYHVGLNGRPDVRSMNAYYNYSPGWAWDYYRPGRDLSAKEAEQPALVLEDLGAVVVDVATPAGELLIWRGTVYTPVPKSRRQVAELDQQWFEDRARELIGQFPPAS